MKGIVENQLNSKRAHVATKKYLKFYVIFHQNDRLIFLKAERWKLYDGWQYRLHLWVLLHNGGFYNGYITKQCLHNSYNALVSQLGFMITL